MASLTDSPLYVRKSADSPNRKFSSTQFDLSGNIAIAIREMADSIPDSELAEDGREDKPHVTIKYGLHTSDAEDVASVMREFGPVEITFGEVSIFQAQEATAQRGGEQYDVVKVDIESERLHELNALIGDSLECTDTHPEYHPHATLAYVKPGKGQKYIGDKRFVGMTASFGTLTFSDLEKGKTSIWLVNEPIRKGLASSPLYRRKSAQFEEHKHSRDAGKFASQQGAGAAPKPAAATPTVSGVPPGAPDAKTQQYVSQLKEKFGDQAASKVAAKIAELNGHPDNEAKVAALTKVQESLGGEKKPEATPEPNTEEKPRKGIPSPLKSATESKGFEDDVMESPLSATGFFGGKKTVELNANPGIRKLAKMASAKGNEEGGVRGLIDKKGSIVWDGAAALHDHVRDYLKRPDAVGFHVDKMGENQYEVLFFKGQGAFVQSKDYVDSRLFKDAEPKVIDRNRISITIKSLPPLKRKSIKINGRREILDRTNVHGIPTPLKKTLVPKKSIRFAAWMMASPLVRKSFDESDHPRADDGKFSSEGSSGDRPRHHEYAAAREAHAEYSQIGKHVKDGLDKVYAAKTNKEQFESIKKLRRLPDPKGARQVATEQAEKRLGGFAEEFKDEHGEKAEKLAAKMVDRAVKIYGNAVMYAAKSELEDLSDALKKGIGDSDELKVIAERYLSTENEIGGVIDDHVWREWDKGKRSEQVFHYGEIGEVADEISDLVERGGKYLGDPKLANEIRTKLLDRMHPEGKVARGQESRDDPDRRKSLSASPLYVRKAMATPFDESEHPRADDGKFGSGGTSKKPKVSRYDRLKRAEENAKAKESTNSADEPKSKPDSWHIDQIDSVYDPGGKTLQNAKEWNKKFDVPVSDGMRDAFSQALASADAGQMGAVNLPMLYAEASKIDPSITKNQFAATALAMSREDKISLESNTGSLNNWRKKSEFALPGDAELSPVDGGGAPLDVVRKKSLRSSPLYRRKSLPDKKGRWVTMGEGDGGSHVFIGGDGTILAGPERLEGKKIGELGKEKEKKEDNKPSTSVDKKEESGKIPSVVGNQPKETKMTAQDLELLSHEELTKLAKEHGVNPFWGKSVIRRELAKKMALAAGPHTTVKMPGLPVIGDGRLRNPANIFVRLKLSPDAVMQTREVSPAEMMGIEAAFTKASNGVHVLQEQLEEYEMVVNRKRRQAMP